MSTGEDPLPPRVAAWPVEDQALIRLLRVALATSPADAFIWPATASELQFTQSVERHRVAPFLHRRLPAAVVARLPEQVRTQLQASATRNARRALTLSAELIRINRMLGTAGIPAISVKGPLLAQALYGEVGLRHAGDLDVLIHPDQLPQVDQLLRTAGLRRSQPDFELTPRQQHEYQRLKHEFEYFNDAAQQRLEIEWRLEGLAGDPFAAWHAAGEPAMLGGETIKRLPAGTEFLYLFVHGAGHGWFRMFWLIDVALLLRLPEVDWSALMVAARASQVEAHVWQGCRLVEMLLGIALPEALRVPAHEAAKVDRLVLDALRLMGRQAVAGGLLELLWQTGYQLRLRNHWQGRISVLLPRLSSPTNWKTLRLPDRWFNLYYPAAPFLWLIRRLR